MARLHGALKLLHTLEPSFEDLNTFVMFVRQLDFRVCELGIGIEHLLQTRDAGFVLRHGDLHDLLERVDAFSEQSVESLRSRIGRRLLRACRVRPHHERTTKHRRNQSY